MYYQLNCELKSSVIYFTTTANNTNALIYKDFEFGVKLTI